MSERQIFLLEKSRGGAHSSAIRFEGLNSLEDLHSKTVFYDANQLQLIRGEELPLPQEILDLESAHKAALEKHRLEKDRLWEDNKANTKKEAKAFLAQLLGASMIILSLTGCAQKNLIDTNNQPVWVMDALDGAVNFWKGHGVDFIYSNEAGVKIAVADFDNNSISGMYSDGTITIDQSISHTEVIKVCVIAHELGHCLGMGHVDEGPNLMSPKLYISKDKDGKQVCSWSDFDQDELDKIFNPDC